MYVIRNTMYAKPDCGRELVEKLKAAIPHFEAMGPRNLRLLTDAVATTWTLAVEMEVDSVGTYFDILEGHSKSPGLGEAMQGYTELVTGGRREIFTNRLRFVVKRYWARASRARPFLAERGCAVP